MMEIPMENFGVARGSAKYGSKPKSNSVPVAELFLRLGSKKTRVSSIAEAQDAWSRLRDLAISQGQGSSDLGVSPEVVDCAGRVLGAISWNGSFRPQ